MLKSELEKENEAEEEIRRLEEEEARMEEESNYRQRNQEIEEMLLPLFK